MSASLVYLKLELKRACKRLPHIFAGAIVLMLLAATVAFLASRMLYGEKAADRIKVGVVLPEGDFVARQAVSMIGSLESVKSICDFEYMDREQGERRLKAGTLYAVMEVPEGFVRDIMNGVNTPVRILMPKGAGLESRIFKELTDAGAATLGAGQAGVYAGDELCALEGMTDSIPQLEEELNRIFMGYSLPRMDYFRNVEVRATGDVDSLHFYGISAAVLFLLLCAIPVSAYLSPASRAMRQKLAIIGVGNATVLGVRILGLGLLLSATALVPAAIAGAMGWISMGLHGTLAVLAVCLSASSMIVFLYQAAGSLTGGVMLLFLTATIMHFLAGGFLPLVFLPASVRAAAPFLPSYIFMEGVKMAVTSVMSMAVFCKLAAVGVLCFLLSLWVEVGRK